MSDPVLFVTANPNLRLVRRTAKEQILPNGGVTTVSPEVVVEFDHGHLAVRPGDGLLEDRWDDETGGWVQQDLLSWLRSHPELNARFQEVQPVAPDPSVVLGEIAVAAAAGDVDRLVELGNEEAATWNRPAVLAQLDVVLAALPAEAVAGLDLKD